ncbi:MAG: hypothetical protein ACT4QG_01905 [Sporichthyaceae bacterium]
MRTLTACTVTALIAGAVAIPAAASATGSSSTQFTVTEKVAMTVVDLGAKGTGPGDRLVYTSTVRGAKTGTGSGDCVVLSGTTADNALYACTGWYRFGSKELSVAGLVGGGATKGTWAINGGTGTWSGARGSMPYRTAGPDTYRLVFQFDN